jgi:hypothetical protein
MAESRPAGTAAAFVPEPLPPQRTPAVAGDGRSWYWEGTVQSTLVGHLASEGYRIKQVANTATKAAGVDIVAERSGRELWVTVKGYPVATSKTNAPVQARHWFSGAIFDAVLYRGERRDVDIVVGLPDGFATYQKLALRIGWLKEEMPFRFAWVSEAGKVREE